VAADRDDEAPRLPDALWQRLRTDPTRAPEHLALAAARSHGPAAAEWLAEKRDRYAYGADELALMARKRHVHFARIGGAATGVGGFLTIIPDLAGLAWIQSRMVFFIAAAYDFDPQDRMRPAELLVLQGLYPEPLAARAALDGVGTSVAQAFVGNRLSRDEALLSRLLGMAGRSAAKRVAGKLVPGLAVAVNAVGNSRDTRALGERAIAFYGGPPAG